MKSRSPKRNEDRITTMVEVWSQLRPTKSFFGMTLAEFKAAMTSSLDARTAIDQAETSLSVAITQRANADEANLPLLQRVVDAIVADSDEGPDGEFYTALGYVRRSGRSTGLTRRRREDATQPVAELPKAA